MGTCSEQLNGGRAGEEGVGSGRVQEVIQAERGGVGTKGERESEGSSMEDTNSEHEEEEGWG